MKGVKSAFCSVIALSLLGCAADRPILQQEYVVLPNVVPGERYGANPGRVTAALLPRESDIAILGTAEEHVIGASIPLPEKLIPHTAGLAGQERRQAKATQSANASPVDDFPLYCTEAEVEDGKPCGRVPMCGPTIAEARPCHNPGAFTCRLTKEQDYCVRKGG